MGDRVIKRNVVFGDAHDSAFSIYRHEMLKFVVVAEHTHGVSGHVRFVARLHHCVNEQFFIYEYISQYNF